MLLKFAILVLAIVSNAHSYNYGENQVSSFEQPGRAASSQFMVANRQMDNNIENNRWQNGYSGSQVPQPPASVDNQDGSYGNIRPQSLRPTTLQRNINFRSADSQQSNLRPEASATDSSGNVASNTGSTDNDVVNGERTNQQLLQPIPTYHAPDSYRSNGARHASLPKNETTVSIQTSGALPLSQLVHLRPHPPPPPPPHPHSHPPPPPPPPHHHERHGPSFYRPETLEQMLNRRPADKFLGPAFIQQQLMDQKTENKFLRVYGKEEREVNGTIEVKKGGLVNAHLEEVKDGKFSVLDRDNRKVGDVNMHRDVEKHLRMTENNGITNLEFEKNTNAELNVERDINLGGPRNRYGGDADDENTPNSSHRVRVHLEQNQNSRANVEIAKNTVEKSIPKQDDNQNHNENRRFRRDLEAQLKNTQ